MLSLSTLSGVEGNFFSIVSVDSERFQLNWNIALSWLSSAIGNPSPEALEHVWASLDNFEPEVCVHQSTRSDGHSPSSSKWSSAPQHYHVSDVSVCFLHCLLRSVWTILQDLMHQPLSFSCTSCRRVRICLNRIPRISKHPLVSSASSTAQPLRKFYRLCLLLGFSLRTSTRAMNSLTCILKPLPCCSESGNLERIATDS